MGVNVTDNLNLKEVSWKLSFPDFPSKSTSNYTEHQKAAQTGPSHVISMTYTENCAHPSGRAF